MTPLLLLRLAWLVAIAALLMPSASWSSQIDGRVVGVSDGDTITVLDASNRQHKVRLAFMDAPELRQPFGHRAKEKLSDLVFGKQVRVDSFGTDRYGRVIGLVRDADGLDVSLTMISAGMAWHDYWDRQPQDLRRAYAQQERAAREARGGLWSMDEPVRPRDYRKAIDVRMPKLSGSAPAP